MSLKKVRPINFGLVFANASRSAPANLTVADVEASVRELIDNVTDFKNRSQGEITQLRQTVSELNTRGAFAALGSTVFGADEAKHRQEFAAFLRNPIRAAMSTDSNPDGGYLVPHTIDREIAKLARETSVMRQLASVVEISKGTWSKVVNLAGAGSEWVGERSSRNITDNSQLAEITPPEGELSAMPKVTQRLLDDAAFDVAGMVASDIATEFSEKENVAFFNGNGVEKPRGFLTNTLVANGSWAWGKIGYVVSGVAAALTDSTHNGIDALIDLTHSVKTEYLANACFVMNRSTAAVVRKFKDAEGRYLWQPSTQVGQPATLLGFPVYLDEQMPNIGAGETPIAFGDFRRGYVIVDRLGVRVVQDPYSSKPYVLFYTTKRVGGSVIDFAAIKLLKVSA